MVRVAPAMAMASAESRPPSVLYTVGANACSLAMRSIHDTKENFLLVCIGFLEALDRLQERLHLPSGLVKELKHKLSKMVDASLVRPVSSPTYAKLQRAQSLGDRITDSDAWGQVARPEEVRGFAQWLLDVMASLNELVLAGAVGVCRRIFILILKVPGVPTACSLFCQLFEMVEHVLQLSPSATGHGSATVAGRVSASSSSSSEASSPRRLHPRERYMGDPSLTAVVLEYREKECVVPMDINRRIQRVMHFQIPLRSFEATVRLPPDSASSMGSADQSELQPLPHRQWPHTQAQTQTQHSSSSPRSIPVSPSARKKYQDAYAVFSDDVLYQARDRLRQERVAALMGGDRQQPTLPVPRFNRHDCNNEIYLTCGYHCATKVGTGMYRSVRATLPVLRGRYVYYEMAMTQPSTPPHSAVGSAHDAAPPSDATDAELSVGIGLSTRAMPLNTLVGTSRNSVGFYSAGHVLMGGQGRSFLTVQFGYGNSSTVGVLVRITDRPDSAVESEAQAEVRFSVNGAAVRDNEDEVLVARMSFPARYDLFPTLSLHTQGVRVYGRFSAPDITDLNVENFDLPFASTEVLCLDGLALHSPRLQVAPPRSRASRPSSMAASSSPTSSAASSSSSMATPSPPPPPPPQALVQV